jgi:hypothetical protein
VLKRIRSFFYLVIACTLLFYGLPRFHTDHVQSISQGFVLLWSLFALLIIGSHLYEWLSSIENSQVEKKQLRKGARISR